MTTNEYYNVVINPDDIPVLGINEAVERPPPLPLPEPEPEQIHRRNIDIRSVQIRSVYKFIHFIMLFTTIMYTIMIDILKIHTFYLSMCFTLASYNLYFEYIGYYFVYSILNMCTAVHLSLDRRDYYISQLISVFPNP